MKSRLRSELHNFLIGYDISLETEIVNHFLFQMAEVIPLKSGGKIGIESYHGLDLIDRSRYGRSDDEDGDIIIRFPGLSIPHLIKMLDYLKLKYKDWHSEKSELKLPETFIDQFIPAFKDYFEAQRAASPELIAKYRVQSKPILESSAISTMTKYISQALEAIKKTKSDSLDKIVIRDYLMLLESKVNRLTNEPELYTDVLASADTIPLLIDCDFVENNEKLKNQLLSILDGVDLYKKYHRNESVFAIKAFNKEMEKYLNTELQISFACTDVIEDTLLKFADIKLGPKGKTKIDIGSDQSRYVFKFEDITAEETKKLVDFLRLQGDETVTEGYGSAKYGSALPGHAHQESAAFMMPSSARNKEKPVEKHSIEIDGKFLHDVLMPVFQTELKLMQESDPTSLDKYREASKDHLSEKLAKKTAKIEAKAAEAAAKEAAAKEAADKEAADKETDIKSIADTILAIVEAAESDEKSSGYKGVFFTQPNNDFESRVDAGIENMLGQSRRR